MMGSSGLPEKEDHWALLHSSVMHRKQSLLFQENVSEISLLALNRHSCRVFCP